MLHIKLFQSLNITKKKVKDICAVLRSYSA